MRTGYLSLTTLWDDMNPIDPLSCQKIHEVSENGKIMRSDPRVISVGDDDVCLVSRRISLANLAIISNPRHLPAKSNAPDFPPNSF